MSHEARPAPAPRRGRAVRLATAAALAAILVVGAWFGVLTARGGHLFMVKTPSMARTAPVGTLVVTEPVPVAQLRVGEIISFRPPGIDRVYTHRIVQITAQGLRTKGDLNAAPDGWVVPTNRVVGRAAHLWFGLGWGIEMLPWFVGGCLVTLLLGWWAGPRNRSAIHIVGTSLSLSLALVMVRPLVRAETIGFVPAGKDGVRMSVVGTGLLPIRAVSLDKKMVDVVPGQVGWVETHQADKHGRYQLIPHLHLSWWGWVLMALFCLLPFAWSLLVRLPEEEAAPASDHHDDNSHDDTSGGETAGADGAAAPTTRGAGALADIGLRLRHPARALAGLVASLALAVGMTPSQAAMTATVTNSTNTVASRTFFTCLDAMQFYQTSSGHNGQLYAGYAMGNGTGVVGTADQQPSTTMGSGSPYTANPTNVTQTAASGGCVSDWNKRQQGYATYNGTSSEWNLPSGSSISNVTGNPGNANNMTWNTWFRTTTTKGGVLSCPGGTNDSCADRTTWMTNSGKLCFGVASTAICSASAYNDGSWHMVTTQLDSTKGMTMWVDAVQVASNTSVTGGDGIISYPQWGFSSATLDTAFCNNSSTYGTIVPSSTFFAGDMQMASMIGADSAGQIGATDITAIYQSAQP